MASNSLIADLLTTPSAARAQLEEELQLKGALAAKPFMGANSGTPISGAINRIASTALQASPMAAQQMVRGVTGGVGSIMSALGAPQAGEALRRGGLSPQEQQAEQIQNIAKDVTRTPEGLREFAAKLRKIGRADLAERMDDKADELMFKQQELAIKKARLFTDSKQQFGSSTQFKDSQGNYYSGTQVRDPRTGKVKYDVIPIGTSPEKPEGKLTMVGGAYGETSMEAAQRKQTGVVSKSNYESLQELGDKTIYPEATQAQADIGRYDIMIDLLSDMETGALKNWEVAVKGLGQYFGLSDDAIASEEVFRSLALRDAIGFVGQTKGAISNMEMRLFEKASPALQNTTAGNKLLIEFSKYVANRKVALADEFARWREKNPNGSPAEWQLHRSKWVEANPNKFLLDDERLNALRSSKTAANKAEEKADSDASFASDVEKLKDWLDANPGKEDLVEKMFKKKYPNRNVPVILRVQ